MTKAPGMHVWRGVCLRKEGGWREFFRLCMFAFHISCWNCRTTQWGSDPWVMCVVSPHCPVSQKNYQNECKERHCVIYTGTTAVNDNISHILRFSVVMTDISVLRRNQFGSLNRWEREKNRRKLYWASHHIWHRNTNKLGNKGVHSYYKTPMRRERQQRLLNN